MSMLPRVILYSDGSHRRTFHRGGYAGLLTTSDKNFQLVFGNEDHAGNGRMELSAVVSSLRYLTEPCHVEVISDATYVVNGINLWVKGWALNNWRTAQNKPIANIDLWVELWNMMQVHHIRATWVKGHAGHPENELVDYVANWSAGVPIEW